MSQKKSLPGGNQAGGGRETGAKAGDLQQPDSSTSAPSPQIVLYSDGLCEPRNPGGLACWGWLAEADGQPLASDAGVIGRGAGMTNNLAEYTAALKALEWAAESGLVGLVLRTDSQLVAYQVTGVWQCRAANLWPLLADLRALAAVTDARIEWVPREQNAKADELSRQAYARARNGGGL